MENKLNLNDKLDFSEIDLTAPEKVVEQFAYQLSEETNGIVLGEIKAYDGHVTSYVKKGFSSISLALGNSDKEMDIQADLGGLGMETHKFECYIYTPEYPKYKYRVFFMKYNIANYPVNLILEESVANSISNGSGYIFKCDDRESLENLLFRIFTSKKLISIMQELIIINQSKKLEHKECEELETETTADEDTN